MRCSSCGQENREGARFCGGCAAPLGDVIACPHCGTSNPTGQKFCDSCGQAISVSVPEPRSYIPDHLAEKILTARSALQGERKQVTVLFVDVKGSMDLAERVDVEAWHRVMDRFFAILCEGVHRFEGTVTQFTGDGNMALFGAPIAHEDHAQRACYSALHLAEEVARYAAEVRRTQGLSFSVRMGLNSGEVVVGTIGDDLRVDYTAIGHTVGLGKRMEEIAEPGKTYLTEHSAALVSGYFQLRDLGQFDIKGVRDPLRVHELAGVGPLRTHFDMARARGLSRFVGRDEEVAALEAALTHAVEGNGLVAGVVGEPGVGKSRLCYELAERCRARGIAVREAHGVAHGKAIPFLPVLELLRGYFGVTGQDGDQATREKVAGRLLLLDKEFEDGLPLLFDFLGVPDPARPAPRMEPEARQRQLFAVIKRLVYARSQREPAVILFEDLHWIDGGSEAFLGNLVEALAGTRTLLLVNFRPEYHAPWMQKSYYQQLPLLPLGPEATEELLQDLLGSDPSLVGLAHRIRERTGGNPFFIEEVVQALVESGGLEGRKGAYRLVRPAEEAAIPATVQAVLAARIDRLGEREKAVLQTAAVIGREFTEPVLRRVADLPEPQIAAALSVLMGAEFIYEEALYPQAQYAFKHPLTQEVAYRSQLSERRARVHGAVARVIQELYADRLDERAALVAHHWEGAGEALEAARWSRRAAEWAGRRDLREASRQWHRVCDLLDETPESPETVAVEVLARAQILQFGYRLGISEEEEAAVFAEGKRLAERSGDPRLLATLLLMSAAVRTWAGEVEEGSKQYLEAARAAGQTGDAALQVGVGIGLVVSHIAAGRLHEALTCAEEALDRTRGDLDLGSELTGYSPYIYLLSIKGVVLAGLGRLGEAARDFDRALELAPQRGEAISLGVAHVLHPFLARHTGDAQGALAHARHALEIGERMGYIVIRVLALRGLGVGHLLKEEWGEAATALEEALTVARDRRTTLQFEALILADLARAYLGCGNTRGARATAEEAVAVGRRRGTREYECEAHLALARVLLRTEGAGSREAIEAALGRALALVEETGARGLEPLIREELAELARLTGDEEARQRELREAHRLFTEMGAPLQAAKLAPLLAESTKGRAD